jgi:hypothetical protein
MTNIWNAGWSADIRATYGRLNKAARTPPPCARSRTTSWPTRPPAIGPRHLRRRQAPVSGRFRRHPGLVFAFINNNFRANYARAGSFGSTPPTPAGANWFGIQPTHVYNVVDLAATNPTALLWGGGITGSTIIANGIYVGFQSNATWSGGQAQLIRLLDTNRRHDRHQRQRHVRQRGPVRRARPHGPLQPHRRRRRHARLRGELHEGSKRHGGTRLRQHPGPRHLELHRAQNDFSSRPTTNELGVHSFLFTATGRDGVRRGADHHHRASAAIHALRGLGRRLRGLRLRSRRPRRRPDRRRLRPRRLHQRAGILGRHGSHRRRVLSPARSLSISGANATWCSTRIPPLRALVIHTARQLVGSGWDWTVLGTNSCTNGVLPVGNATNAMLLFRVSIPAQ